MKIISVVNQKGGVGKTTIAVKGITDYPLADVIKWPKEKKNTYDITNDLVKQKRTPG